MEKEREAFARELIEDIETYQEAYVTLCDAGYDEIEADYILIDFFD